MSECAFCGTEVQEHVSVCRGAERIEGYVSQQTMKGLVAVGTIVGISAGFFMACLTKSTPVLVITLLALMPGPLMILKFKTKDKISWVRPTAR
ncbi:hypothetical protein [Erwinia sp. ErVv1]|uniref:hypothetical protein n=1 Tax=Erwinia sp. ErVv1 TaxID=1603299 RepID=UPI000834683E|nr:hypothetical protein [Erwinia sp. ErVv1]